MHKQKQGPNNKQYIIKLEKAKANNNQNKIKDLKISLKLHLKLIPNSSQEEFHLALNGAPETDQKSNQIESQTSPGPPREPLSKRAPFGTTFFK